MNRALLTAPFPAAEIRTRKGREGKTLSYVSTAAVIARLNEACARWDFQVVRYEILDDEVVVLGRLVVEGIVTKAAFGGSAITRDRDRRVVSIGDDLKAAASDALKKSASLLGVGLALYGGHAETAPPRASTSTRPGVASASAVVEERLTPRQRAAIETAATRAGMTSAQLTALVVEHCGRHALADLTKTQASALIAHLSRARGAAA